MIKPPFRSWADVRNADLFEIAPAELLGLAALSLSLGVTYWLVRDTDEGRRRRKDGRAPSASGPV